MFADLSPDVALWLSAALFVVYRLKTLRDWIWGRIYVRQWVSVAFSAITYDTLIKVYGKQFNCSFLL